MRFERTLNPELVASVWTDPRLYGWLADDYYPDAENFWPAMGDTTFHVLAYDGDELLGLFSVNPVNRILWEVHVALLPQAWGVRAKRAALEFFAWVWANLPAEKLFCLIADDNRAARKYALRCGLRQCGRLMNALRRGGELKDLVLFDLERPKDL
jgi:RimJ/RimL family protein N-acetyltransferase